MSNVSFGAQITRNFDGVASESSQRVKSDYDKEIARIKALRDQAVELDTFMSSDEVSKIAKQLPKKDFVDIKQSFISDQENEAPSLSYYVRDKASMDKLFKTTLHPEKRDDLHFSQVRKEDGSLNKEGIVGWLNHLVEFFGNK